MEIPMPPKMGTLKTICHDWTLEKDGKVCEGRCTHPWEARWRDGNRQPRRRFPHKERNLAIKALTEAWDKKQMAAGKQAKPSGRVPLMRSFGIDALSKAENINPRTRHKNVLTFINHGIPYLGNLPVDKVTHRHIADLITFMETTTPQRRRLTSGTINLVVHSVLGTIFKQAIKERWISENPCHGHQIKPFGEGERYVPLPSEVHLIATSIPHFWRAAIYVLAGTGIREGELLGLTPDCIKDGYLYIYRQWRGTKYGYGNLKYDKEAKGRIIPLDPIVLAELQRHIEEYDVQPDQPIFYSPKRPMLPFTQSSFEKTLRETCHALGFGDKRIRPHNFRHFFASRCVERGVQIAEVSRMLGHKSIQITYETYYQMTNLDGIKLAINSFLSDGIPEGTVLAGVHELSPKGRATEIEELRSRLEALTGKAVVLEDLTTAA